jgi:predicted TIM-barrel fold metal-dependent hydrolase
MENHFEEIISWAEKNKLVLQFHTGSGNADILEFEPFIEKYAGKLPVQLVHMGGITSGHFKFVPRFQKWVEAGLRVYCDTSFTRDFAPGWLLRELMEKDTGLDRVLFASDYPWGLMEPALARIDCLDLPADVQEKVFFKNAEKLYLK